MMENNTHYDVIIIGSGPAGYTAAIYTGRANLKTLVLEGLERGGQLMITNELENFPGFPDAVIGPDFMELLRKQAQKFGAELITTCGREHRHRGRRRLGRMERLGLHWSHRTDRRRADRRDGCG